MSMTPSDAASLGFPTLPSFQDDNGDDGASYHKWSSLIGIVTAIVGNVLISFALNTQRYAHIRIEREFNQSRLPLKRRKGQQTQPRNTRGYGTLDQQQILAEERLQANLAPGAELRDEEYDDAHSPVAGESDPLNRSFLSGSDDSLGPAEKIPREEERKSYLRSPYWWAGIVMMTIGEAGNFIAYGFAPASIVSPLGVVALVSNCLIAPLMLKEKFRKRDLAGVLIAVAGAVVVVLSARTSEDKLGPEDLWEAIKRWEFLTYVLITAIFILALMWASGKYGHRSILIDVGLVGLFGGYTALSTKGVASLLSYTLWKALTFPITYILVAVLIASALMQIRHINLALQRFDSTQVIPTQFVCFTLSVIIGSAVLYRDFESTGADRVGKFVGGCALTFLGVFFITGGRHNGDVNEEDDVTSDEGGIDLIDEEAEESQVGSMYGEHHRTLSAQMNARLLPSRSRETFGLPGSRRASNRLKTPVISEYGDASASPSVAVTPETPSPFAAFGESGSTPWADEASHPSTMSSAPRLQTTQSSTQVETFHRDTFSGFASSPSLLRTPSAPNPSALRPGTRSASPAKADPSSHIRITGATDAPPATPSRSMRNSISHLLPGPLTISPLSSGLSAVVAESLRRGEGSASRRRLGIRRSRASRDDERRRQSVADEEHGPLLSRTQSHHTPSGNQRDSEIMNVVHSADLTGKEKKNRLRSVSDTLGSLMKGKRRRKDRSSEEHSDGENAV